jgi:hypothetical protein
MIAFSTDRIDGLMVTNEYDHTGYEGFVDVIFSVENNGTGTAYTSTAPNLIPVFSGVRVAQS